MKKYTLMKHAKSTLILLGLCSPLAMQAQPAANKGTLQEVVCPMTVTGSKVTGSGNRRKGTIKIKNTGKRSVKRLEVDMFYLGPDGSVGNSVPHTTTASPTLGPGISTTIRPPALFMKKDTAAVAGVITAIAFDDGSRWPPAPAQAPAAEGDAPVGLALLGVIGKAPLRKVAVACHNHGKKDVSGLMYFIEFFDGDGKQLGTHNFGYNGDTEDPFLKSGTGSVLTVGKPLPEGTEQVRLSLTNVFFADETLWKAK